MRADFKYDVQGNWTERLISHRQESDPSFAPTSIERRHIAYHRS
jgi:hypothetical protein